MEIGGKGGFWYCVNKWLCEILHVRAREFVDELAQLTILCYTHILVKIVICAAQNGRLMFLNTLFRKVMRFE